MTLIEIIYLSGSTVSIAGMVPQIRQLVTAKRSEELSAPTWLAWAVTQAIAMMYAISIHARLLVLTNAIWFGFYLLMLGLIWRYRIRRSSPVAYEYIDTDKLDDHLYLSSTSVK